MTKAWIFQVYIHCDGLGFNKVPDFKKMKDPYEVGWTLYLSDNKIETIPQAAFQNIDNLRFLVLSNNSITTVDNDAFSGAEDTLYSINFEKNYLQDIPMALTKLKILFSISLSENPLKALSDTVTSNLSSSFQSLTFGDKEFDWWPMSIRLIKSLTKLTVTGLAMPDLPLDAFVGMETQSLFLWFQHPTFDVFPKALNVLHGMTDLMITEAIHLNSAGFTDTSFVGLSSLKSFYISHSGLSGVPDISHLRFLQELSISNSPVKVWPTPRSFPRNLTIIELDLTYLTTFPEAMLIANSLNSLSMFETPITRIDRQILSNFPKLQSLSLGKSNLSYIPDDLFADSKKIKYLDLSNINIIGIPRAIRNLSNLFMLNLDGVPVACTCKDLGWMKNWPPVKTVRVNNMCSNLPDIPLQYYMHWNVTHCP